MKHPTKIFRFLPLLAVLFTVACGGGTPTTPTVDPAAIYTAAVQTAQAQLTLTAMAVTNTPEPTITLAPTATGTGPTQTPLITNTPLVGVTNTPFSLSTALPTSASCDNFSFVSETIPDGTHFAKNEWFDKTWTIKNTGPCDWTADYMIGFGWGDQLKGDFYKKLGIAVKWGDEIDITVHLQAPSEDGTYYEWWTMANDRNVNFGIALSVVITVP